MYLNEQEITIVHRFLLPQIKSFATDFEAERQDRQSFEKRYNDAMRELQQRDNVIEILQHQVGWLLTVIG